ncbi:MAG TPA: hypothetical protein VJH92_04255 [Candidatus Nanoarchaeia archaeon]|nr:hypothetical protein [Candidatus Nanoarchaeia archaeon]
MAKKRVNGVKRSFIDKYFTLDWKEFYLLVIAWFLFLALHFIVNIVLRTNERVLYFIAMKIVPVYFSLALVYTFAKKLKKGV